MYYEPRSKNHNIDLLGLQIRILSNLIDFWRHFVNFKLTSPSYPQDFIVDCLLSTQC